VTRLPKWTRTAPRLILLCVAVLSCHCTPVPPFAGHECQVRTDCPDALECSDGGMCLPSGMSAVQRRDSGAMAQGVEMVPDAGSATASAEGGASDRALDAGASGSDAQMRMGQAGSVGAAGSNPQMTMGQAASSGGGNAETPGGNAPARSGEVCDAPARCSSGFCVDGRCCDASNCALCTSCAVPGSEGRCTAFGGADDPDGCSGNQSCGAGLCAGRQVGAGASVGQYETLSGMTRVAQTIKFRLAGQLVEVRLGVDCAGAPLRVELFDVASDGTPGNVRIARANAEARGAVSEGSVHGFSIEPPLRVSSGQGLAIVVAASGATCRVSSSGQSVYSDGDAYSDPGTSAWNKLSADLAFELLTR